VNRRIRLIPPSPEQVTIVEWKSGGTCRESIILMIIAAMMFALE
jgi:hypothetical protein